MDRKYDILSKKDAATTSEEAFVKQFTDMSVEDTWNVFNPFFQLDFKCIHTLFSVRKISVM